MNKTSILGTLAGSCGEDMLNITAIYNINLSLLALHSAKLLISRSILDRHP
mgnify:CR=1 FL=1